MTGRQGRPVIAILAVGLCAAWGTAVLTATARLVPATRGPAPSAARFDRPLRYADGAPPGFSGGFEEQSCHGCPFDAAPNATPGRVAISGAPDRYSPGQAYRLTVTLERPGLVMGGFQLTARFADGGGQAGSFSLAAAESDRVKIERSTGVEYASHRKAGAARVADGKAQWTITWTAPASGAAVRFHVAANAANGDESASGDFVYTATHDAAP
jgi:hypothetical protein